MQGVMKLVVPLRIEALPASFRRLHHARIIGVTFGDYHQLASQPHTQSRHLRRQLLQKCKGRGIYEAVRSVHPESIHAVVAQPHQGVIDEEASDVITAGTIQINRLPPRCTVGRREIWAEPSQLVPYRSQVVVNHIKNYVETQSMTGV